MIFSSNILCNVTYFSLGKQFNQNDAFHADCGEGKILNVLEADYRTPGNGNSECGDEASMAKVKEECNGKNRCQFTVNDDFFDSTCPSNKQEKLWIEYRCENSKKLIFSSYRNSSYFE